MNFGARPTWFEFDSEASRLGDLSLPLLIYKVRATVIPTFWLTGRIKCDNTDKVLGRVSGIQ